MANQERTMNLNRLWDQTRLSVTGFWAAREPRERKVLVGGGLVLALGLYYALLITPALSSREALNKNLPELKLQVAQMQALAKEASGLTATAATPVASMSEETLKAALSRKGLKPLSVVLSGDQAKVQLAAAPFNATLEWLDDIQKNERITVTEANFNALPQAGMVDVLVVLRQQKNE
jgi:general secretion pathway protein M